MHNKEAEAFSRRKLLAGWMLLMVLAIVLGVTGFLHQRNLDREAGYSQGYTSGYCIGYTDCLHGRQQNAQKLAGEIVPYEPGSGKWKYFIMGFDEGYADGLLREKTWDTNES